MLTRKLAPAWAAGCTVIAKPAPETPLTALLLARILDRLDLPPGALNVVTTSRAADVVGALLDHPATRKLSFTGSTAVGRLLAARAGHNLMRGSLELGGNAPFIVVGDADLDRAGRSPMPLSNASRPASTRSASVPGSTPPRPSDRSSMGLPWPGSVAGSTAR